MPTNISHMTFIVKDLEKASLFFTKIFDAKEIYSSGEDTFSVSKEKYFLIGELWICIMEGTPTTQRTYNHIAFQIQESEIDLYLSRINEVGAEVKPSRPRVAEEGQSIYFYDFDDHLFELHAGSLSERLERYALGNYENHRKGARG